MTDVTSENVEILIRSYRPGRGFVLDLCGGADNSPLNSYNNDAEIWNYYPSSSLGVSPLRDALYF